MQFVGDLLGLSSTGSGSNTLGFGGGFQNTSGSSSTNTSQNSNLSSNTSGTTSKVLTPYQTALQAPLFNQISQLMTNPTSYLAPFQTQAMDQTSSSYAGLADSLKQQFLGTTGGGSSGKFGTALAQGNLQRIGALQNVGTQFAQEASELPLTAASLASNLLGQNFGQTTTGASSATSASTGTSSTKSNSTTEGLNFGI